MSIKIPQLFYTHILVTRNVYPTHVHVQLLNSQMSYVIYTSHCISQEYCEYCRGNIYPYVLYSI
jgi:hypothetical protein